MEFNALVWAKAQDGQWHRGTVISREETGDLRHIKVRVGPCARLIAAGELFRFVIDFHVVLVCVCLSSA